MNPPVLQIAAATPAYRLRLAVTEDDLVAAQRLRYEVFNVEMHEGLASSVATGRDEDEFDAVCDHLLVEDTMGGGAVGTYRLQTGKRAAESGLGYYSAREFDFGPFERARGQLIELGRACVGAEHRNPAVLGLLWRGIAQYAHGTGARFLTGCSSLTSQDEDEGLAVYQELAAKYLVEEHWRTLPQPEWRCRPGVGDGVRQVKIPRLMGTYLMLGAKICGEPAIDRSFGTIDFLTWMDLEGSAARTLRRYLG
jgi:putative hemolysin